MRILAIDYGRRKIGLAISEDSLAQPLKVLKINSLDDALIKVKKEILPLDIEKIVVGLPTGAISNEVKEFARHLEKNTQIPLVLQDETLTTQDANSLAIEANIKRKKRRGMEDAYSAALILQSYLENKI